MKAFLKQRLPASLWSFLGRNWYSLLASVRRVGSRLVTALAWIVLLPLRLLPVALQASVKERLNPVKPMDFAPTRLLMSVGSSWQHLRLRSASKEPETVQWIADHLREGDVFYDVGANVGAYSLIARAVGHGLVRIYAFEPGFETFRELCRNIWLNHAADCIVPLQMGLGRHTGIADFVYADLAAGAAQHSWKDPSRPEKPTPSGVHTQPTLSCRLDDIVSFLQLPQPTIMKIDVDGPEYDVLCGAPSVLVDSRLRTLLIEIEDSQAPRIRDLLEESAFRVAHIHRRGSTWCNYIFTRGTHSPPPPC